MTTNKVCQNNLSLRFRNNYPAICFIKSLFSFKFIYSSIRTFLFYIRTIHLFNSQSYSIVRFDISTILEYLSKFLLRNRKRKRKIEF